MLVYKRKLSRNEFDQNKQNITHQRAKLALKQNTPEGE